MTTPLTTADDFPRSDIDVAQIRTTRSRIVRLKNDYKAVMQRIEAGLHAHHAEYRASSAVQSSSSSSQPTNASSSLPSSFRTHPTQHDILETPFAKVHTVAADSPAEQAGLRPGDKLRRFGDVTWMNHEKLSKVAEVVQRSQGRRVVVKISRVRSGAGENEELELGLTPRAGWGGRGLLGCQILPL